MKAAILTIIGLTAAEGLNDPFQDEQTINREFIELENLQEGDIKGYLPHKKLRGFRKNFWRYLKIFLLTISNRWIVKNLK